MLKPLFIQRLRVRLLTSTRRRTRKLA